MKLTGSQALLRCLQTEQVRFVFGIASGKLTPLMHALSQQDETRFVGLRHEASGPMMAAAQFAAGAPVAVALGEMGPGGINLLAGAGGALANGLALLMITTNQHRAAAYPARGMFMDLDSRAAFAPLCKWNAVVHDGRRLPELVRTAFRHALAGRPGPVHLDIPQDVLAATHDYAGEALFAVTPAQYRALPSGPRPDATALAQAHALLAGARRPLIVAGGGVVRAGAQDALRALAERLDAPVVTTQMGLGLIASDSPHFIGQGGLISGPTVRQAFENADVLLSLGCRHSSWLWDAQGPFARHAPQHISINIDPLALGEPALHSLGLQADAGAALADLLALLGKSPAQSDPAWRTGLHESRRAYEARLQALAAEPAAAGEPMHPAALAQAIGTALPAEALAVFDGGHTSFWSNDLTPTHTAQTRFHEPGMCQLGFGLPAALGLQLLHPQRPVFNITGDGSFGFTLQELDTARRARLPVVTVIHNNASWGVIRSGQRKQFDFEYATALDDSDYAAIARGFGCHGERVGTVDEVGPAIARALASGLPAVLDCRTRFVPHPCMEGFGSMNRFGF